jgi:exodeoxyribonuclease VII large subunit
VLQALSYFNNLVKPPEVLVLTRGGGSLEDLLSFNDEQVARAIFSSKIPVVSAIGHEEDVALTDFVADLRASTPSNAAELLVPSRVELAARLRNLEQTLIHTLTNRLNDNQQLVAEYARSLSSCLLPSIHRVEVLYRRLTQQIGSVGERLSSLKRTSSYHFSRLQLAANNQVHAQQEKLQSLLRLLESLDYQKVLARGYSITTTKNGKVIRNLNELLAGESLITNLHQGSITSSVISVSPSSNKSATERQA